MAEALNEAKSAWDECMRKNCKKCSAQYAGKKFVAVRRAIGNGAERNVFLGQEIHLPKLEELKKLNQLYDVPMEKFKHIPPHMTAIWTVKDEEFLSVATKGSSSRVLTKNRPKQGDELTVVMTGLSHCRCILEQFARAGRLNGPTEVQVDTLEVSSSTEYSAVGDDRSYHRGLKNKLARVAPGAEEYLLSGTDNDDDEEEDVQLTSSPVNRKRTLNAAEKAKLETLSKLARKSMKKSKSTSMRLLSSEDSSSESEGGIAGGKRVQTMMARKSTQSKGRKSRATSKTPSSSSNRCISTEKSSSESNEDIACNPKPVLINASTPKGNSGRAGSETIEPFPIENASPVLQLNHPSSASRKVDKTPTDKNVRRSLDGVLLDYSQSPELNGEDPYAVDGGNFNGDGCLDRSLVIGDVGPTIVRCDEAASSSGTCEKSKFLSTEPLWQSLEIPLKQEFRNDLEKLQRVKTSLLRVGTKGEVNAAIGKEGVDLMQTLMQRMNGVSLPSDIINLCKQACSKFGDFVEHSLQHQDNLENEVVGAYRYACAHAIESMTSKRSLILCKHLISPGGSFENFSHADWSAIGNPEEPDFIENFSSAYKYLLSPEVIEGIGSSKSEILDSAQKASRAKISERVIFPTELVLLANDYKGPHGHEVGDHDKIMRNDPAKLVFHYRHYDKMQNRWYRPVTEIAWIRENDFRRLQDEFNAMSFIDPKDPRYKFPEAQYTHFNSFLQIFIQTFMRNPAVQYNFWNSCLNPLAQVMVQILTGLLRYFGVRDNERRKMRNEPTYEYYEQAIRAAITKLNKICSDSRRRALGGNEQIAEVNAHDCDTSEFGKGCPVGKVRARRRYDQSVPNPLNLVEFCDDSLNQENSFIKCFWKDAPESYMDLALSASRRQQQTNHTPIAVCELERSVKDKLTPQEVEGPRPKIFSTTPTSRKQLVTSIDPTTGVDGSIKFKSPRKQNRRRKTKASLTNAEKAEKRVQLPPSSVAGKENEFNLKIGANVYNSKSAASEAIRNVLIQTKENIDETDITNGIRKVLRGKITLNELVTSIDSTS